MRACSQLRNVDRTGTVNLQEGQQRRIETTSLKIGELVWRLDNRLSIAGASELKVQKRHTTDRTLLNYPADRAVLSLFQQDPRNNGRNTKTNIHSIAVSQFHRDPTCNDFGNLKGGHLK